MSVLLDQFVQTLCDSGLMTKEEVQRILSQVAEGEKPTSGEEMATLLYRHGKLTKFQAQAVYRGKAKGLTLGDYVVLDEIGHGGMGAVYKAQHRRMKRMVALKVLPPELTKSESAVRRFQQEVEAAARLIHPNVVTAFDAGESKNIHFLVMEYVDGQDLAAIVAHRGVLPVAEAVEYVLQAARGLAYAHGEGVVHRDVKPSNLLLDKNGTVKILDMGLARADRGIGKLDETADRGLTQSGDVMGTVDYMSPEQAASTKHVDARADIYSLGCTLFYLLNGRPVYEGTTLVDKVLAHREKPIPKLNASRDDVPSKLDLVFRRMVGKKPEQRFGSMKEVIAALESCPLPKGRGPGGKPGPGSVAETLSPTQTVRAAGEPSFSTSGVPAPPSLTPRDRTPAKHSDLATRRGRVADQAKTMVQQRERKQAWTDAVDAAVRQQRRTARWDKVRSFVRNSVAGIVRWGLLLAVLAGIVCGGILPVAKPSGAQEQPDRDADSGESETRWSVRTGQLARFHQRIAPAAHSPHPLVRTPPVSGD